MIGAVFSIGWLPVVGLRIEGDVRGWLNDHIRDSESRIVVDVPWSMSVSFWIRVRRYGNWDGSGGRGRLGRSRRDTEHGKVREFQ